jgi:hypothetical protein
LRYGKGVIGWRENLLPRGTAKGGGAGARPGGKIPPLPEKQERDPPGSRLQRMRVRWFAQPAVPRGYRRPAASCVAARSTINWRTRVPLTVTTTGRRSTTTMSACVWRALRGRLRVCLAGIRRPTRPSGARRNAKSRRWSRVRVHWCPGQRKRWPGGSGRP